MSEKLLWTEKNVIQNTGQQIVLSGSIVEGACETSIVVVNYTTIPGNLPVEYGNWAGFWRDPDSGNFWDSAPIAWAKAQNDSSQQILIPLSELIYGTYHVGYFCDPGKTSGIAPCATLAFPGVTTGKNPCSTSINVASYMDGVLKIAYTTPPGNNPRAMGNQIAICVGDQPVWDGTWMNQTPVDSIQATGLIDWTVSLKAGATYTVAYMDSSDNRNIAACCVIPLAV